jgi:hypothetical protein
MPSERSPRLPRWFLPGLLLLLAALLAPSIFGGKLVSSSDLLASQLPWSRSSELAGVAPAGQHSDPVYFFEPWQRYAERWVSRGVLPLRNPDASLGAPFLANAQSALLSPFTLPYYVFPLRVAAWLSALMKMFVAGSGAALLALAFGRSGAAAAFAGTSYALCGFVALWLTYPLASALVFLPWALLGVERLPTRPRSGVAGVALAFAFTAFGGHPECAFHVGALALSFAAWRAWQARGVERRRIALGFLGASVLGGLLAAPQVLPFVDYMLQSNAFAARNDSQFSELRLAHPPALGSWLGVSAELGLLLLSWQLFRSARRSPGRGGALALAAAAGTACGLYGWLALRAGAWNVAPLLLDAHYFGVSDPSPGAARYVGPLYFAEANGGYLGAIPLVLALLAPALAPARDARFRFCFFAWLVCFLVAIDAPPFSQLLQHVPPFGVIVNRRLLGAVAIFGALLAAAAWDGLATLDAQRRRGLVLQVVAVVSSVLAGCVLYDARQLSDRPGIALLPDPLPPRLGDAVASVRAPSYNATIRGDRIEVTGFALSVEPLASVHVRLVSDVDRQAVAETDAAVGLAEPRPGDPAFAGFPTASVLVKYPRADASGFRGELDFSTIPAGPARIEILAPGEPRRLIGSRPIRIERPRGYSRALLTLPIALLGLLLATRAGGCATLGRALLAAVALGDLATFAWRHLPQIEPGRAYPPFAELGKLATSDGTRIANAPDLLAPNTQLAYGLASIQGRDVLEQEAYKQLLAAAGGKSPLARALGVDPASPFFPLLGVGRIAAPPGTPVAPDEGEVIERGAGMWVVAPKQAPIRARFYPDALRRRSGESTADCLKRVGANAHDRLVLGPAGESRGDSGGGAAPTDDGARLVRDDPNEIEVDLETRDAGWLLVTDLFSPHFRATIDGTPAAIEPAYGALVAVQVPAGAARRTVRIAYVPRPWTFGLAAAGLGLVLLVGLAAFPRRRERPDVE